MWIIPTVFSFVFIFSGAFLLAAGPRMLGAARKILSEDRLPVGEIPRDVKPIALRIVGAWFILVGLGAATMTYFTFG
ncbi:hypothetical protein [Streptomyces sp. AA0539]|uniref:hypothetical protein n=1 Tax=Streptomyces sp. AA0539 TaxID=1210045 RepID=UPI001319BE5D|nr:hypothetical protein [Streptomyces sp. AA0539]